MNNTGYEIPLTVIPHLAQGYLPLGGGAYLQASPLDMSIPQGAGGLYSTVEDLARWNQWLYNKGSSQTVLSEASKAILLAPAVQMALKESPDTFYSYGLVLDTYLERQRIHHVGGISGFASALAYYPEKMLTVIVLSNFETAVSRQIGEGLAAIVLGYS
ncbi:MAG: serine hydrolase domain-containing protein [Phormidesmis sp.]